MKMSARSAKRAGAGNCALTGLAGVAGCASRSVTRERILRRVGRVVTATNAAAGGSCAQVQANKGPSCGELDCN